jgi:hypothetical protein
VHLVGFYYKSISWCTVLWMSNSKVFSLCTCNYYISCHVIHNVVDFKSKNGIINYDHIITFLNKRFVPIFATWRLMLQVNPQRMHLKHARVPKVCIPSLGVTAYLVSFTMNLYILELRMKDMVYRHGAWV